jgi:hypothetical protein
LLRNGISSKYFQKYGKKQKCEETDEAGPPEHRRHIAPIEMVRQLGWREKQRVTVRRIKGGMVIRDYKNRR